MTAPTPNPPRPAVRRPARKLSHDIGIRARIIALRSDLRDADPRPRRKTERPKR